MDAGAAPPQAEKNGHDRPAMPELDLHVVPGEAEAHLPLGPGLDFDMDQSRPVRAGEGHLGEEVELAPLALRPVGEDLLVQKLPAGQVEAPGRLGRHKGQKVGEERPEQVLEDLVVEAPVPPLGARNIIHALIRQILGLQSHTFFGIGMHFIFADITRQAPSPWRAVLGTALASQVFG